MKNTPLTQNGQGVLHVNTVQKTLLVLTNTMLKKQKKSLPVRFQAQSSPSIVLNTHSDNMWVTCG